LSEGEIGEIADEHALLKSKPSVFRRWWLWVCAAAVAGAVAVFILGGFHVKLAVRHHVRALAGDDDRKAAIAGARLGRMLITTYVIGGSLHRPNPHAKLGPWATPLLVQALRKRGKDTWEDLVGYLGQTGDPQAFAPLVGVAEDESVPSSTRSQALMMIGTTRHPKAFEYLVEWLDRISVTPATHEDIEIDGRVTGWRDVNENYRMTALQGILFTMDRRGVALFASYLSDRSSLFRRLAVMNLGEMSLVYPRDSIPHLIRGLEDANEEVRFHANAYLWRLTGRKATEQSLAGTSEARAMWNAWWQSKDPLFTVDYEAVAQRSQSYRKSQDRNMLTGITETGKGRSSPEHQKTQRLINVLKDAGGIAP